MKKWVKILIGIIATPIVLIIAFVCYYLISNVQGEIEPYTLGDSSSYHQILIASQGSEFKTKLVNEITARLENKDVYLSIVDCTNLENEDESKWDAIIIIHTTQIHGMPKAADSFMSGISDHSKVILITTSGGGDEVVTGYNCDAISAASRLSISDQIVNWAIPKVEKILDENFMLTLND